MRRQVPWSSTRSAANTHTMSLFGPVTNAVHGGCSADRWHMHKIWLRLAYIWDTAPCRVNLPIWSELSFQMKRVFQQQMMQMAHNRRFTLKNNKSTESWQCCSLTIQYLLQLIKALRTRIRLTFDDPSRESLDLGILALLCQVIKLHGWQQQWIMWCCNIGCWCVLASYLTVCWKSLQLRSYSSQSGMLQPQPCNYACPWQSWWSGCMLFVQQMS